MSNEYYIRFNTKNNGNPDTVWRVFENNVEHLVKGVQINTPVSDKCSYEGTEKKWNIYCEGTMKIVDNIAIID